MIKKYNPEADLSIKSQHLASLLYILGVDRSNFSSTSIDDVINAIRNRYIYKHDISLNIASQEYIKKQSIVLNRSFRRAWFDVQVANYEVANG
jgi:hypothetical protein